MRTAGIVTGAGAKSAASVAMSHARSARAQPFGLVARRPGRRGWVRAHFTTAARDQTRPIERSATGGGKSSWVWMILLARWRDTPRICPISGMATSSSVIRYPRLGATVAKSQSGDYYCGAALTRDSAETGRSVTEEVGENDDR